MQMTVELISTQNIRTLTELTLELWSDSNFDEELEGWKSVLSSKEEMCYLAKDGTHYIGFIHLSIRKCYVEGAESSPIAYIEALYVKEAFRKSGVARILVDKAEGWAIANHLLQIASDTEITNLGSIDFHLKAGFTETNRLVCFLKDL